MDNQDKLFDKIKEASQKAEFQDFPGMEKVWARVEEKLDKKEDKKRIALWKKIAVAASLLLLISLGYQFLHSDKEVITDTQKVVFEQKEELEKPSLNEKNTTPSSDSEIVSNEEAVKILENQTKHKERVAIQEIMPQAQPVLVPPAPTQQIAAEVAAMPEKVLANEPFGEEEKISSKKEMAADMESASYSERASAKVAYSAAPTAQRAKKSAPLVVLNGRAIAHSDDVKKDKMMQEELPNLQPENVDSLMILDDPLYIIDGIYYSEQDLFGKKPTSPYAPLDNQEIKTITILQDLEATEKYGEKGKKGVVIITTKNGKPALKK